ncbi:pantoate--beta-alanine ligase [Actinocorallia sp. A-T 12471]|uniref:pantoate--beta-alanine ligase n=1 Tax=Actinocorallia sp. A-T 12471 TaxID=3089813 RepID=UPI0029D22D54|nr:pantoate--beta-alanine ligase [Actinocorallia sp. A-T 12471]MDX6741810.1 pantoate--beta-alanine ligase [Actinocorallia sp. A-T 12471]
MIVHTVADLRRERRKLPGRVAFVPTMGALHEGHRALIRAAKESAEHVVVSVFVNPLQFGEQADLDRYPRTLDADAAICAEEGAELVFAPSAAEVYPRPLEVSVQTGRMGEIVEGAARPGHFDGMATVVAKLFGMVSPDLAFFGQKDAQQLAIVRRLSEDLNLDVEIVAVPTVREPDGFALSSRNRFLSPEERVTGLALSRALFAGRDAVAEGPEAVLAAAGPVLEAAAKADPPLALDYLVLADPATFTQVPSGHRGPAVLAVAGRVGATRLIDNLPLEF